MRNHGIDFTALTNRAYKELIDQPLLASFPINPHHYRARGHIVISYQKYCELSGMPLESFLDIASLEGGFAVKGLRPGLKVCFYDEDAASPRKSFTIFHEAAHHILGHNAHGAREEIEANFFASQIVAPNRVIVELKARGYEISRPFLMGVFNLGAEAAEKKLDYFERHPKPHKSALDAALVDKVTPWLSMCYPKKQVESGPSWDWMKSRI